MPVFVGAGRAGQLPAVPTLAPPTPTAREIPRIVITVFVPRQLIARLTQNVALPRIAPTVTMAFVAPLAPAIAIARGQRLIV